MKSWSKTLEKTVQHFCTSAEYAKDTAVTFLKNVDWKKVAIDVGVAVDTTMETVETAASGGKVDLGTIAASFVINAAVVGDSGNTTKTVNQLRDSAKDVVDMTSDSIRREVKETTQDTINKSQSGLKMDCRFLQKRVVVQHLIQVKVFLQKDTILNQEKNR